MERISLSNAVMEGNNNVYLFADGPETVLVDTGDWMDSTRRQLIAGLADYDVEIEDVDRIFLTHWHADHSGLAGLIQRRSGAEVHVHAADAKLVEGDPDSWDDLYAAQLRFFKQWGMPDAKQAVRRERMTGPRSDELPVVTSFEDGDVFSVNDHELTVVHAPGHAAGLCMFETTFDGERVVFSGDALLPKYTPNVGGADVRVDRPLEKYLRTLRGITTADYARAWPGHRDPISDPTSRAEYIIDHHEERAWRVLTTLRNHGPIDTWTVSAELFGELEGVHILHGPGEAYAHLDHLERMGAVVSNGDAYRLADGVGDDLDGIDDEHWNLGI